MITRRIVGIVVTSLVSAILIILLYILDESVYGPFNLFIFFPGVVFGVISTLFFWKFLKLPCDSKELFSWFFAVILSYYFAQLIVSSHKFLVCSAPWGDLCDTSPLGYSLFGFMLLFGPFLWSIKFNFSKTVYFLPFLLVSPFIVFLAENTTTTIDSIYWIGNISYEVTMFFTFFIWHLFVLIPATIIIVARSE